MKRPIKMTLRNGKFYRGDELIPIEHGNKEQIEILETANRYADEGLVPEIRIQQIVSLEFRCLCGALNEFQTEPFDIDDNPEVAVPGQINHCHYCDLEYVAFNDSTDGLMLRLMTKKEA